MPTWSNYLALDLGAESGRVFLVRTDGRRINARECHRYRNKPTLISGHLCWDYPGIFGELKIGVSKACREVKNSVSSMAIDTWGTDFGFITRTGEVAGLPYAYRDQKNEAMVEEVRKHLADEKLYSLTGIQIMKVNTLYQLLALVRSKSPLVKAAEKMLFLPDLFAFLFCGSRSTEYTIASTSQLLDPVKKTWQAKIFELLGLPYGIMPEIKESGATLGKILPEQAGEMQIPRLVLKTTASHDTASAVACVPVIPDDKPWAFISSGTWSLVGTEVPKPFLTSEAQQSNLTNEGGVCETIRLLKNVTGMWFIQRLKMDFSLRGVKMDYPELTLAAESAGPFRRFIDTENEIFHNPPDMVTAIDQYLAKTKQPGAETPAEYARCVFESLAYRYAGVLSLLERTTGKKFARIHIVGGGARNDLLNAFVANASGKEVLAGPVEATALGNGLLQALSDGLFGSLAELRKVVSTSCEIRKFLPTQTDEWRKNLKRYQEAVSSR